jgi:hypothetical protein
MKVRPQPFILYWLIRLIPALVLAVIVLAGLMIRSLIGPYYAFRFDSSYAYLLNALNILRGLAPGHIDHPGTTVQELGGATIYLRWWMGGLVEPSQRLTASVLTEPEKYLDAINYVLLGIVGCAVAIATRSVLERTGRLVIALAVPILLLTSVSVLNGLGQVAPEPLLIALAIVAALLAMPVPDASRKQQFKGAALFGIVLGAGIVTKITFVPVIVLMLGLPNIPCAILAGTFAVVSMGMLTYPIWSALGRMFEWHEKLLTHEGLYGNGPKGLPPVRKMLSNAATLLGSEPLLLIAVVALVIGVISLALRYPPDGQRRCWSRFFAAGTLLMVGQLAVVAKHPLHLHYLVPAIAVAALLVPLALHTIAAVSAIRHLALITIVVLLPLLAYQPKQWIGGRLASTSHATQQILLEMAAQRNCLVLPYYQFSSIPYALHFGNFFANRHYSDDLTSIYPGSLFYNIWVQAIEDFIGVRSKSAEISLLSGPRPICPLGSTPLDNSSGTQANGTTQLEFLAAALFGAESMFLYQITSRPQQ